MKTRGFLFAGLALLVVLGVVWFLATHDRVPTKEWVAPSGEARLREFLAAQRFAERMGWKVSEVRSLPALDALPASGTLLLPNRRQALPPAKIAEILAWVDGGGHLLAEAEYLGVADPLFEALGVVRSPADPEKRPFVLEMPQSGRRLQLYIGDATKLEIAPQDIRLRAGSPASTKLISFTRGRGLVTAATSLRFARNPSFDDQVAERRKGPAPSIAADDHAELFWHLLALSPARELNVYFRPERLSLWRFLTENAAPALVAIGLMLGLWLWSIVPRFGPVVPDLPPGRRRLLDHLRASGRYYWANGLRSRLVVAARDAALRRVTRAQPDFALAPEAERVSRLSAIAGISKEDAARFMTAAGAMRGADFIRVTQHAQRIHSSLEKGAK
ncbi:MAG: hypothetical protein K0R40_2683 [Burkholderiales bacterium]|jgi:hypothetical protein|nr:hypothetical protein [Burkholderiales bacterium]